MLNRIMKDESGVLTFEWILLITVLVIGLVGALSAVRDALNTELGDVAEARAVYKTLGQRVMNAHLGAYVISPDEQFEKFFDRRADKKRKLYNGMLKCNVYMYR